MVVTALHHTLGAQTEQAVVWLRVDVPDDRDKADIVRVEGLLELLLVRKTRQLGVVLVDVVVAAMSAGRREMFGSPIGIDNVVLLE
jgi:hypothetical protein